MLTHLLAPTSRVGCEAVALARLRVTLAAAVNSAVCHTATRLAPVVIDGAQVVEAGRAHTAQPALHVVLACALARGHIAGGGGGPGFVARARETRVTVEVTKETGLGMNRATRGAEEETHRR